MKRITLFFALLAGLCLTSLQAQTCSKSTSACCKKAASVASADKAHCAGTADAAAKLASLDESIEARTCEKSGHVSYVRKETNPETGTAVFTSVEYNSEMGKFVNVSPSEGKSCGTVAKSAGCCTGKGKATSGDASSGQVKQTKVQKGS